MEQNSMNIKELAVVWQSKKDMYKILQVEGGIYLPPLEQANHLFIAQIVTREKLVNRLHFNFSIVLQEFRNRGGSSSSHQRS